MFFRYMVYSDNLVLQGDETMNILQNIPLGAYKINNSKIQQCNASGYTESGKKVGAANATVVQNAVNQDDNIELSDTAKAFLKKSEAKETTQWLDVTKQGNGKYKISFDSTAIISRVLQQGYMMIDGHQVTLDEKQLKQLRNVGLAMQKDREAVHNRMTLEHDLAVSRQQSDAWKKQAQSQNRAMNTATRMMKGRKVSQDDEKELAQMFPELYRLAKVAAAMEKIKEDQEDHKISEGNARQREEENTPKDYSVPQAGDYPTYSTDVNVEMTAGELQISSVREVTHPAVNL